VITYDKDVDPKMFATRFRETLEIFADRCEQHRYNVHIFVTNGYREGDPRSHGLGQGADIRTNLPGWQTMDKQLQLQVWLAAMWAETCMRQGYRTGEWGIGAYPLGDAQPHIHVDVRPHTAAWSAVWVGAE
jgi:hypothetical protein